MLPSMVERTPHTSICCHCTCHHSRMDMPELVRQCCRGDAGARGGVLYDVVHSAFGEWLPWPTYRAEHGSRCRSVTTAGRLTGCPINSGAPFQSHPDQRLEHRASSRSLVERAVRELLS
jgi:hypothetical protein